MSIRRDLPARGSKGYTKITYTVPPYPRIWHGPQVVMTSTISPLLVEGVEAMIRLAEDDAVIRLIISG